jgi:hypothetical protein
MSDERTAFELRADCLRLMDEAEQLFTVDEPNDDIHRNNQIRGNQLMGQAQILASLAATTMGYELFRAENENQDVAAPSVGKLPDTETLLAETPDVEVERYMRESFEGVGELEWRRLEDLDGKPDVMFVANALHAPFSTWQIARGLSDGWCLFPPKIDWNVEQTVLAVGSSVRGLQSLANSLQRILSGAAE